MGIEVGKTYRLDVRVPSPHRWAEYESVRVKVLQINRKNTHAKVQTRDKSCYLVRLSDLRPVGKK